jgi:hypothetical protein
MNWQVKWSMTDTRLDSYLFCSHHSFLVNRSLMGVQHTNRYTKTTIKHKSDKTRSPQIRLHSGHNGRYNLRAKLGNNATRLRAKTNGIRPTLRQRALSNDGIITK